MTAEAAESRVSELEERVAALEEQFEQLRSDKAREQAVPGWSLGADEERFWALAGLRERLGDRSAVLFTGSVTLPTGAVYVWQQEADGTELLDADWEDRAMPLAALGHPVRLRIMTEVLRGRASAAELATLDRLGTTGQLYYHVRQLMSSGWLQSPRRGQYEVPAVRVIPLLTTLVAARS